MSGLNYEHLFKNANEQPEPAECKIEGSVPKWIHGTLLRNGPGMFHIGPDKFRHWFDGLALVQRFRIENEKVYYSSRYVTGDSYKSIVAADRIVVAMFGTPALHTDPCKNMFERFFSYFIPDSKVMDNGNVNVVFFNKDELYAVTETTVLNRIDWNSLETKSNLTLNNYVAINKTTAHPHYDSEGNVYNVGSSKSDYLFFKALKSSSSSEKGSSFENLEIIARIPQRSSMYPSYYHSFGMSENYIFFPEMPLVMNVWKLLTARIRGISFAEALDWHPEMKTNLHLYRLSKQPSYIYTLSYTADPFFTFHHVNMYEDRGCVIADLILYKDGGKSVKQFTLDKMRAGMMKHEGYLYRFVMPLQLPEFKHIEAPKPGDNLLMKFPVETKAQAILQPDGKTVHCVPEQLCEEPCELPRINYEGYNGKKYRYCYAAAASGNILGSKCLKIDVQSGQTKSWTTDHEYQVAGEPVFLAKPGAQLEDEGVVLVPVSNAKEAEHPFLLILDGQSFEVKARAEIPGAVPLTFHGHYVPEDSQ